MGQFTVRGKATVYGKPDRSTISLSVKTQASTAKEAREKNNQKFAAVTKVLADKGTLAEDIQSSDFEFGETYSDRDRNIRNGFYARNSVKFRLHNLKVVASLIDELAGAGATGLEGPDLAITNPRELEDEARQKAVADAYNKAALYVKAAQSRGFSDLRITGIASLTEKDVYRGRSSGKLAMSFDSDEEESLMVGQVPIEMEVEVVFTTNDGNVSPAR